MLSRKRVAAAALCAAVLASALPAQAATDAQRARRAAGFLARKQADSGRVTGGFNDVTATADAVVAWVVAQRGEANIKRALRWLRRRARRDRLGEEADPGVLGKVVMAVEAAGGDARRFGGRNLVREINDLRTSEGRLGASTEVFSHALLMLGLQAAGRRAAGRAAQWLVDAQCGDGGWQFDEPSSPGDDEHCSSGPDDFTTSDTNTTALAVQALSNARVEPALDPFAYLRTARDRDHGGWGFSHRFTTGDANSTGLVIQAFVAAGRDVPYHARRALRGLQIALCGRHDGAFEFSYGDDDNDGDLRNDPPNVGATLQAVPALRRVAYPVPARAVTRPAPRRRAC